MINESEEIKVRAKKWAFLVVVFLVLWVSISVTLPPRLYAESEDGKWEALYDVDNSAKGTWSGNLYWDAMEGEITLLQFYENEEQLTGDVDMSPEDYIDLSTAGHDEFVFLGTAPFPSNEYKLLIKGVNEGKAFEQMLEFKNKRRFFVIPKLN